MYYPKTTNVKTLDLNLFGFSYNGKIILKKHIVS